MKKIFLLFPVILIVFTTKAQVVTTHLYEFDNVNFNNIVLRPDGYALAFGHGITNDCDVINTINCLEFGNEWTSIAECSPVEWPESYLIPANSHFVDNDNGFVIMTQGNGSYGNPGIYKTTDGGESWEQKYGFISESGADGISDFAFKDASNGIAIRFVINYEDTFVSSFIRTTDGGETWVDVPDLVYNNADFKKIIAIDGMYYLYGQDVFDWDRTSWFVYKSEDGVEWTQVYREETPMYYSFPGAMHFLTENIGYIAIQPDSNQYSIVKKTIDGGVSWTDIVVPTDVVSEKFSFNDLFFIDENRGFIVAGNHCDESACYRGYAILYTSDGGETWGVLDKNAYGAYALYDMDFNVAAGVGYVVGGDIGAGHGNVFKVNFLGAGFKELDMEKEVSIYPNPSNGIVYFDTKMKNDYKLTLFTTEGKNVFEKIIDHNDQSIHLNLLAGFYLYEINDGNTTHFGKIIIE